MNFKKISSRVKSESPLGGVARKASKEDLGYLSKVSLALGRGFKILSGKSTNVITQVLGWENPDPTTNW